MKQKEHKSPKAAYSVKSIYSYLQFCVHTNHVNLWHHSAQLSFVLKRLFMHERHITIQKLHLVTTLLYHCVIDGCTKRLSYSMIL